MEEVPKSFINSDAFRIKRGLNGEHMDMPVVASGPIPDVSRRTVLHLAAMTGDPLLV